MTRTSLYRRVLVGALVAVVLAGVSLAASAALSPSGQAAAQQGQGGRYVALSSARLLDTRVTTPERPAAPLAGYQGIDIQVAGKAGVPATGALGAAVTVVPRDGLAGYGQVWSAGDARPTPASNINWGNGSGRRTRWCPRSAPTARSASTPRVTVVTHTTLLRSTTDELIGLATYLGRRT